MNRVIGFLLVLFAISCGESDLFHEENSRKLSLEELSTDKRFISLINKKIEEVGFIGNKNVDNIVEALNKVNLSNKDLESLCKFLGYENISEYQASIEKEKELLLGLQRDYTLSAYSMNEIISSLDIDNIRSSKKLKIDLEDKCDCSRKESNCKVSAAAISIAGQIACLGADLTVFGGMVCHAALTAKLVADLATCNSNREDCEASCNN